MTSEREEPVTVREWQELQAQLASALLEVSSMRWQLDAVTEASARLEESVERERDDVTVRVERIERHASGPVDERRLPERVTQTVDWTAEQRAIVEARKRRR